MWPTGSVLAVASRLYLGEAFEVEIQLTAPDFGADRGRQFMRLRTVELVAKDSLGIARAYLRNSFYEFKEAFGDVVFDSDMFACMIVTDETMRNEMGHGSVLRLHIGHYGGVFRTRGRLLYVHASQNRQNLPDRRVNTGSPDCGRAGFSRDRLPHFLSPRAIGASVWI
jgi:hypothetical protein